MKMKAKSITATRLSTFSSPCTEAPSCFDAGLPVISFRLRKRNTFIHASKLAANNKLHYVREDPTKVGIDDFASALKTPCLNTLCSIPPELQLPSFDDDEDERQMRTRNRNTRKSKNKNLLGVRIDLSRLFEAVADELRTCGNTDANHNGEICTH
eukprot:jgi/Psemu1/10399/gm1.10399_g